MIIECKQCGESWDTEYLRSMTASKTEHPDFKSWDGLLDWSWRQYFIATGYRFGATVGVLEECPSCIRNETEEVPTPTISIEEKFAAWHHPEIYLG